MSILCFGMLAAVIVGPTLEDALMEMERSASLADMFEIRLDFFTDESLSHIDRIVAETSLPLLFTFRKKSQGGARDLPESLRIEKLRGVLSYFPTFCDLEADTDPALLDQLFQDFPGVKFIGSYHNFEQTPPDLASQFLRMRRPGFSFYKIAVKANSTSDMLRLMLLAKKNEHLSCISMGEYGRPSRLIGPVVGSAISYASFEEENELLFRYSLRTLHTVFNFSDLNRQTELFALLGDPVEQSPGDLFHNEAFRKQERNALYIKMRVSKEELPEVFPLLRALGFRGLSITIPLKEAILPFLDYLDPDAKAIGAVNTVVWRQGVMQGSNTDGAGALNAIESKVTIKHKRLAILGAGGTARAIAFEAKKRGAHVAIFNRDVKRAIKIGSELGVEAHFLGDVTDYDCNLLINTIPPQEKNPYPKLPHFQIAMDVVYHPKETPFLRLAKEQGAICFYGEEMFFAQAKLQQGLWSSADT